MLCCSLYAFSGAFSSICFGQTSLLTGLSEAAAPAIWTTHSAMTTGVGGNVVSHWCVMKIFCYHVLMAETTYLSRSCMRPIQRCVLLSHSCSATAHATSKQAYLYVLLCTTHMSSHILPSFGHPTFTPFHCMSVCIFQNGALCVAVIPSGCCCGFHTWSSHFQLTSSNLWNCNYLLAILAPSKWYWRILPAHGSV